MCYGEKNADILNDSRVIHLKEVDSTNEYLKKLAAQGAPSGTVVIADMQTGGKGSKGRSFLSPSGKGLYFSYLYRPACKTEEIADITAWTAVAAANAVASLTGETPGIKWVNDLVLGRKKICGILSELVVTGGSPAVVIGIGINVNHTPDDFPPEILKVASSLYMYTGKTYRVEDLAAALLCGMDALAESFPSKKDFYLLQYRKYCITAGRAVTIVKGQKETAANALYIDDGFSLVVKYDDGSTEALRSGDVSVRGLYGYTD